MKFYNTPHRSLEEFTPLNTDQVSVYTCGPTVYSNLHIGNWVSFLRWDMLVRHLTARGYTLNRVMNITDVGHLTSDADEGEDKMQKGARQEGITEWDVAAKYTRAFTEGMEQLNLVQPQHLVKATDHIDTQISLIKQIEEHGHTYLLNDGLYFDTSSFPSYAAFAHLDLDAQKAGARVHFNSGKKNSSDFVLWRLSPAGEARAMEWDSPWGKGIPGWHIECSAMAMHYLGSTIDIHTGGIDHIPVHHTNEIAQSESATGKTFVKYWLHNAHLLSDGTKISKSLNNGYTLEDLYLQGYTPQSFRMFVLQSHYRTESNFSWENLNAAQRRLERWKAIAGLRWQIHHTALTDTETAQYIDDSKASILIQLDDDLNSPESLVYVEQTLSDLEKRAIENRISTESFNQFIDWLDTLFGLQLAPTTPDITPAQKELLSQRQYARSDGNWDESDKLRDEMARQGITLKDASERVLWYRSSTAQDQ